MAVWQTRGCKMAIKQKKIIIADDDITALAAINDALTTSYDVYSAPSAAMMFDLIAQFKPDIILLDAETPELNSYETVKLLRECPEYNDIAIIFITSENDASNTIKNSESGAENYIYKSFFAPDSFKRIVKPLMRAANRNELKKLNDSMQNTPDYVPLKKIDFIERISSSYLFKAM